MFPAPNTNVKLDDPTYINPEILQMSTQAKAKAHETKEFMVPSGHRNCKRRVCSNAIHMLMTYLMFSLQHFASSNPLPTKQLYTEEAISLRLKKSP